MIKAVVFDIGGVLEIVDDDRWQEQWIARWEAFASVEPGTLQRSLRPDVMTEETFRGRVGSALSLSPREVDMAMAEWWDAYCGELDVAMCDFVRSLRAEVIVVALTNSADGARREEQRRYGFAELFDDMIYSHEVGLEKPDPAIYRLTEERLGVKPHEIVFLDDRESAVQGARAAGWTAVRHESTPASIAAIHSTLSTAPPH